jgi:hypothetical protein
MKKSVALFLLSLLFYCHLSGQNQKNIDTDSVSTSEYNQEWDFYFNYRDNKPISIALDLGYQRVAPLAEFPYFVWVSFKINMPLADGLCSDEESKKLWEIEDSLCRVFKRHKKVDFVGRLTSDGARDIYFYLADTLNYQKDIREVLSKYPYYEYDYGTNTDPGWNFYLKFLYPKPIQYQSILNRRMVDDLDNQGDNLTLKRDVFHWIYFKTVSDRENFLLKIKNDLFTVVDKDEDNKYNGYPYRLHLKRSDKVDWDSVDDYVLYLWQVAKDCGGTYDSWETTFQR